MSQAFSLSTDFGVALPFYVRKLDRRTHWDSESPECITKNVFPVDEDGTISVFRVESRSELTRIAVAMNANRVATNPSDASRTGPLFLVAIRETEFLDIELQQAAGKTDCILANRRHFGARPLGGAIDGYRARANLVECLLRTDRKPFKLTKGTLKEAWASAESDGCHAVVQRSERCNCEK